MELVHAAITPAAIIEPQRRCAAQRLRQRRLRHADLIRRIAVRGACLCTPNICESAPRGAALVLAAGEGERDDAPTGRRCDWRLRDAVVRPPMDRQENLLC